MRIKGVIKSWNDERGFGIEPVRGGHEVFFHITAFPHGEGRPQINQRVLFEVERGPEGKKRARNVEVVHFGRSAVEASSHDLPPPPGIKTLFAIPAFMFLYIFAMLWWEAPVWFALVYLLASAITFLVYKNDKSCAQRGSRRTPEATLHALSFAGGWPGALLAQQLLRHKSVKREFRMLLVHRDHECCVLCGCVFDDYPCIGTMNSLTPRQISLRIFTWFVVRANASLRAAHLVRSVWCVIVLPRRHSALQTIHDLLVEIGRASCRERV